MMIKKLTPLLCLSVLALASCEEDKPSKPRAQSEQEKVEHWQAKAIRESAARQIAEEQKLTSVSRAETLEKAVIVTGIAAVAFLILGGAMGSKAKNDVLDS